MVVFIYKTKYSIDNGVLQIDDMSLYIIQRASALDESHVMMTVLKFTLLFIYVCGLACD